MQQQYTAIIQRDGQWYIGWIEEVPGVNCQEESLEALLESLRITLAEALDMNRQSAREAAGNSYRELCISV
jgi:predicted RNase H-like HicB family nuclease